MAENGRTPYVHGLVYLSDPAQMLVEDRQRQVVTRRSPIKPCPRPAKTDSHRRGWCGSRRGWSGPARSFGGGARIREREGGAGASAIARVPTPRAPPPPHHPSRWGGETFQNHKPAP